MRSKWKLWDFFKANNRSISPDKKGLYAVHCFDPIIMKLFKDQIPSQDLEGGKLHILTAKDVTADWIEQNLQTMGLFGNSESYLVHFAQDLSKDAQEKLLNEELLLDDRYFIMSFEKENDFYKELVGKDSVHGIDIQAPMFWENRELLEFFSSYTGVYLDYSAAQKLQDSVEATCSNFLNILEQLKINFGNESITSDKLDEVLSKEKLDQFLLAEYFATKKFSAFYKQLLSVSIGTESLQRFFAFMQKHMGKICDPSYLDDKKKLSKYDRQILSCSKIWKKEDALRSVGYFKELEVEAKLKKPLLTQRLRRDYLRTF
ncbi:MAG: hypothetical protein KC478_00450 [Bacteriovoracaceae bacterium]|nr:hypothetical protein [Bacteriovoracaceae bacterium]